MPAFTAVLTGSNGAGSMAPEDFVSGEVYLIGGKSNREETPFPSKLLISLVPDFGTSFA